MKKIPPKSLNTLKIETRERDERNKVRTLDTATWEEINRATFRDINKRQE